MGSSYLERLARAAAPYVLFYLFLCSLGGWDLPLGWLIPLPVLLIAFFRILPRSRFDVRDVNRSNDQVLIRYADYNTEHTVHVALADLKTVMKRDPSTIYRRYVMEFKGPNFQVRQYERGKWSEQHMYEVLTELTPAAASVPGPR